METIRGLLTNFDWKSRNVKLGLSFVLPLILFVILAPGVFFMVDPNAKDNNEKVKKKQIIPIPSAFVHAFVFAILVFLFIYFYLLRDKANVF